MKKQSVLVNDMSKCIICETTNNIEIHHVYFGSKRDIADRLGLVVPLCTYDHTQSKYCPHKNRETDLKLKQWGQVWFEENKGNREMFISLFGKSYL